MTEILDKAYAYVMLNNKATNAYHNNEHILMVFRNSMMLFDMYRKEYELKSTDRNELGLAALFHDFNHSGGKVTDDKNIEIAIDGFQDFMSENSDTEVDVENVIDILQSTEFPHKPMDLNILQKIIRDADTMGGIMTDGNTYINVVYALAAEYKKSLIEFLPIQLKFIDTIKFNTPYCNKILEERRDFIEKVLTKMLTDLSSN